MGVGVGGERGRGGGFTDSCRVYARISALTDVNNRPLGRDWLHKLIWIEDNRHWNEHQFVKEGNDDISHAYYADYADCAYYDNNKKMRNH